MKFDWGGVRVEHNDVPKLKKKVLTTITETLKKLSPAGQEVPLRCEGLTGWELYVFGKGKWFFLSIYERKGKTV